jgi:hypothetical protein
MKFAKTSLGAGLIAVSLAWLPSATPGRAQGTPVAGGTPITYQWQSDPANYSSDAPEDVTYFYGDLSPYGTWVDLEGYGWCWQPAQVAANPQWQPYCDDGHWVYTEDGWYWQSDYAWGWAPFHYGRWLRHERAGWVWFPDRVWGPAWVTWRMAGDNCGWAPLPLHTVLEANAGFLFNGVSVGANFDFGLPADCFTFVAMGDFCAPDVGHHRLGQPEVAGFYGRTSIINDYGFANQTVVNRGIPVDRIAAMTHTTIRPIAVRDEPVGGGGREAGNGAAPVVYRRMPGAPDKNVVAQAQKVDERHPTIQHGGAAPYAIPANHQNVPLNHQDASIPPAQARPGEPVQVGDAGFDPSRGDEAIEPPGKIIPPVTRSRQVANQAHALPPLFVPHDEPEPPAPSDVNLHDQSPRSQKVANQAHALPPLKEQAPPVELARPKSSNNNAIASPRDKSRQQQ